MTNPYIPVNPYHGEYKLKREHIANFFCRSGRGVNCRMDVPVLTIEDIKWAATIFNELAEAIGEIAYKDDRPDIYRVLHVRHIIEESRIRLVKKMNREQTMEMMRKTKEKIEKGGKVSLDLEHERAKARRKMLRFPKP